MRTNGIVYGSGSLEYRWNIDDEFSTGTLRWEENGNSFKVRIDPFCTIWINGVIFNQFNVFFSPKLRKIAKNARRILKNRWRELRAEKRLLLKSL